jgi:MFS family permease
MAQVQAGPGEQARLEFSEKVVVLVGGIIASMALTVINPVLPNIEKALAHTATEHMLIKQLFGATTLAMVAGAPLGGFLVARLGMRKLLLVASLVFTISGTAGFYLSSLPLLLISRLFVGASAACIQVMSLTLVNTRLEGFMRAKWMGLHVSIAIFCSLVVMPVAGVLGDISWRWPFILYALGLIVFVALMFGEVKEMGGSAEPAMAIPQDDEGTSILFWMPWHYVLLSLAIGAITFLPTIYMPYQLRQQAGLSPSGIAGVLTIAALIGGISAFMYGRARRFVSVHVAFVIAFGLAGAGMLIAGLADNLPLVACGMFLHSLGNAWFVPNIMTSLGNKLAGHQQARAAGLVKAGHFFSTPFCVIVIDPIARQYGAVTVMLIVSATAFSVVALMLVRMAALGRRSLQATPAPLGSASH